MSVVSVRARSFILALFIRDDGERFLLGDNGFDFKDSQLHFSANTIENDEVEKQGVDGVMLAGQVRRASVQSFDGYVGDATMAKETIEQMRRDFFAFFIKGHHFRVVYIDCNRNAWQRKGGYLVDAPEVKELWQIHPEYHVGLNFEDVNYYEYDENAEGEEILSNIISVPISSDVEGGLVWDENGAVSESAEIEYDTETATASGKSISVSDAVEAPLSDFKLKGNTVQNGTPTPSAPIPVKVVTGENVVKIYGKNLVLYPYYNSTKTTNGITFTDNGDGTISANGTASAQALFWISRDIWAYTTSNIVIPAGTYTIGKTGRSDCVIYVTAYGKTQGSLGTFSASTDDTSFTVPEESSLTVRLSVASGATLSGFIFRPQIELGSTATAYEPYQGQSYEVNLGKNLFDKDNANIFNGYLGSSGIVEAANARAVYIPVVAGQTYTFSRANSTSQVNDPYYAFIANEPVGGGQYLEGRHAVGQHDLTFTGTAPAGSKYLIFYFAWNPSAETLATILSTYQLELGSQATSYAAYFEPIQLCGLGDDGAGGFLYQDGIYKNLSDNKWYVRKEIGEVVLDESKTYTSLADGPNGIKRFKFTHSSIRNIPNSSLGVICDLWRGVAFGGGASAAQPNTIAVWSAENMFSITTDSTTYTVADFKTSLTTSPATVYYALATPTDTEITNEALIEQLEAILSQGYTYAGTNNITTVITAGNEQGELEITYYTKYDAKVVGGGYVWEAGGSGGPTVVTNESISAVSPVWTVFGPALNPMLENTTAGEQIQYVSMVGEGQTLVVDMGEQTARLDGLNVISNIVGEYLTLAPGSNTLLFSAEGDAPASEIGWSEIVG